MDEKLKFWNWHYCWLCHCRSYSSGCTCHSTSCNAGGCPKCGEILNAADQAKKDGKAPPVWLLVLIGLRHWPKMILFNAQMYGWKQPHKWFKRW
jgi:hypothetical protein